MSITRTVTTRIVKGIIPEVGDLVWGDLGGSSKTHLEILYVGKKKVKLRYFITGGEIEMTREWLDDQREERAGIGG